MVSDLYLMRLPGEDERFLLDVSEPGRAGLLDHFKRVLPPRLAKVEDVSQEVGHILVVGPDAAVAVAAAISATGSAPIDAEAAGTLEVDQVWFRDVPEGTVCVVRSSDTTPVGYDLFYPSSFAAAVTTALLASGAEAGSEAAWQALRIEAGTPEFGTDMTEETIPIEAGIEAQAIDGSKGCYTGQEVIVRIMHRGHVNRHLRTLRATSKDTAQPVVGDELFVEGSDKSVGRVTSMAFSGQAERLVGLGYVRREVEIGAAVTAKGPGGPGLVVSERGQA